MNTISKTFGHAPDFVTQDLAWANVEEKLGFTLPINPRIVSKRHVGIEVEVEQVSRVPGLTYWKTKPDNSLRNGGIEFVSVPVSGQRIVAALAELQKSLPKKADFSLRTSIHVHLNVTDLEVQKVLQLILVYLAVEPLMYKFVGRHRDKNNFCVPMYLTDLPQLLHSFEKNLKSWRLDNHRYSGLNLDSLRKFGTLEFRQMPGTHDLTGKLVDWINLILCIANYTEFRGFEETIRRICSLNTNSQYSMFLDEVFGTYTHLLDRSDLKSDLEKGVMVVKYSLLANKFISELKLAEESPFYKWALKNSTHVSLRSFKSFKTEDVLEIIEPVQYFDQTEPADPVRAGLQPARWLNNAMIQEAAPRPRGRP